MKTIFSLKHKLLDKSLFLGVLFLFLIPLSGKAQYIEVDDSYTAQQLVEEVFIGTHNLGCIEVSNIQFSNYYNFGAGQMSYGYFNKGNSDFYIDEGVLLTTGKARSAIGPNTTLLSEGPAGGGWPGDQDLEQAVNMTNTTNATALEFDFVSYTNHISFDYVFASEQYLTSGTSNQCNYTDAFAFLIKRANVNEPYTNLAIIPGTNTPVAVNTVRGPGGLCSPVNAQYFGGFNEEEHPTNYNGQTIVLTAQTDIIAGEMYHIKLVIADQGNNLYDSAVFLRGGSFSSGTIDLGQDRTIALGNPICEGGSFDIDATIPNADTYTWYRNGQIINGETSAIYTATQTGNYEVEVGFTGATCVLRGEILVEFSANPIVNNSTIIQCEGNNGDTVFNLTLSEDSMVSNTQEITFSYFETLTNAQNDQNNITNIQSYTSTAQNQVIYVRVTNQFGCYSVGELTLSSSNNLLQNPSDLESCDDNFDGMASFDLTENQNEISSQVPINATYQYFESFDDALLGINQITSINTYQAEDNTRIYVKIMENGDCFGVVWFDLIVRSFDIDLSNEQVFMCDGNPIQISAPTGFSDYTWNNEETTQNIEVNQAGSYTVSFTNEFGCRASKTYVVSSSSIAVITSIQINDMNQTANSILVTIEGTGEYEYSLNGINYQESNLFTNVDTGVYTVSVRNSCGEVSEVVYVLDFPKFFTPNGDGINDYWRVPMLSIQYPTAVIEIYDRYGKLIHGFRAQEIGWDGTFNSENLPSTDYWFVIKLPKRIVKGHFSLIR